MSPKTADLDELLVRDEQLQAMVLPVWILFGATVAAVIGVLASQPVLGVVGWVGGWFIGPWVISRAAVPLRTPARIKVPLFLACAVPFLSLAAPVYVWQASRTARTALAADIRQAEVRERRRAPAPPGASTASAAPRAPTLEALPVLRAVAPGGWAEGEEVQLQVSGLPPGMTAPDMLPPTRAAGGVFAVGYHVDAGSAWTSVSRGDLRDAGLSLNALHRQALSNLMKLVKGQPGMRLVDHPPYHGLLLDGDHEACLVLLDGLWDHLFMDKTPNGAVVAIPSRDVLAFCDANSAEGIAALRAAVARIGPDATGALFQGLLRRRDGRWTILQP